MKNEIQYTIGKSSLGSVLVAENERGICAISLGDSESALISWLHTIFPTAVMRQENANFTDHLGEVLALVESPHSEHHLPLDMRGTPFQQKVWNALREIKTGTTSTYSEIAERINSPKAVRAVANACGANRLAIVIPCHRVIQKNGSLAGYRWGVERKRELLRRETETHLHS